MSGKQTTLVVLLILSTVLALPSLGFASWCLYDGLVTYPERVHRYNTYRQIEQIYPETYPQEWQAHTAATGWPSGVPRRTSETDIFTQYIMSGFCGLIGLVFGVSGLICALLFRRSNRALAQPSVEPLSETRAI